MTSTPSFVYVYWTENNQLFTFTSLLESGIAAEDSICFAIAILNEHLIASLYIGDLSLQRSTTKMIMVSY